MQVDELTAATFADPRTLVTGGADNVGLKQQKKIDLFTKTNAMAYFR
jgi:hypothetical protein